MLYNYKLKLLTIKYRINWNVYIELIYVNMTKLSSINLKERLFKKGFQFLEILPEIFDNDLISTFLWKFSVGLKISLFYGKTTINFNVLFQNN